jgi:hypothetical protein
MARGLHKAGAATALTRKNHERRHSPQLPRSLFRGHVQRLQVRDALVRQHQGNDQDGRRPRTARCTSSTPPANRTPSTPARRSRWTTWVAAWSASATASARRPPPSNLAPIPDKRAARVTALPFLSLSAQWSRLPHPSPVLPRASLCTRRPLPSSPRDPYAACRAWRCCCSAWPTSCPGISVGIHGKVPTSPRLATWVNWPAERFNGLQAWLKPLMLGQPP